MRLPACACRRKKGRSLTLRPTLCTLESPFLNLAGICDVVVELVGPTGSRPRHLPDEPRKALGEFARPHVLKDLGVVESGPKSCYILCAHWTRLPSLPVAFCPGRLFLCTAVMPRRHETKQRAVKPTRAVVFIGKRSWGRFARARLQGALRQDKHREHMTRARGSPRDLGAHEGPGKPDAAQQGRAPPR